MRGRIFFLGVLLLAACRAPAPPQPQEPVVSNTELPAKLDVAREKLLAMAAAHPCRGLAEWPGFEGSAESVAFASALNELFALAVKEPEAARSRLAELSARFETLLKQVDEYSDPALSFELFRRNCGSRLALTKSFSAGASVDEALGYWKGLEQAGAAMDGYLPAYALVLLARGIVEPSSRQATITSLEALQDTTGLDETQRRQLGELLEAARTLSTKK